MFLSRVGAPLKDPRDALNIAHQLNRALSTAKVLTYICIYRLNYNKKDILSWLMAPASISSILLRQHQEQLLKTAKQLDQVITDATGDQI